MFYQFGFRFLEPKEMFINELSHETIEELCGALEKVPTLDWKVLMRSGWFRSVYSEDDIATIAEISSKGVRPAKVLLDDMTHREIALQDLVNGLKDIGNNKAVSIIMKGSDS